ncbi:hypothetical protein [Methylorubrum rhodesianum]|uniref:hypothetical protein n=1 Tax=Methylorubrum rhodesianum TaxID=29427 RepID=UPI001AEDEEEF|nr:hypothetical protein [Methylorubrum rhodesianum]
MNAADRDALIASAGRLGTSPVDLGTVISYETGGTFSPSIRGGSGNRHIGLIQFGIPEQRQYGASQDQSFGEQLGAVERYLTDRGFKPGMGLLDLYSTINAGRPGRYNASDAGNGGAPGTVADKVNGQMAGHRAKASAFLGGDAAMTMPAEGGAAAAPAASGRFGFSGIEPSAASAPTMATPEAKKDEGPDTASILKMLAGDGGLASMAAPAGGAVPAVSAPPPMVPPQRRAVPFDRDAFLAQLRR